MGQKQRRWLWLRGLAREQRHWGKFPQVFAEHFPKDHIVCLDLPGSGRSHGACPFFMSDALRQLKQQWDEVKSDHQAPSFILGHSLGGMMAMKWMATYPNDFQAGVIVNSSSALSKSGQRMDKAAWRQLLSIARTCDLEQKEDLILQLIANLPDNQRAIMAHEWASYAKQNPIKLSTALKQILWAASFRPSKSLSQALLMLSSRGDKMVSPKCTQALVQHFGCAHQEHASAGHDLCLDDPQWVIEQIKQWQLRL